MPHQCLKCGKVFPSGSMEIFRGCSNCKGKRFFYTEQPINSEERKVLTERADKDIKELVRDMLTQRRPEQFSTDGISGDDSGWVKVDKDKKIESIDKDTSHKTKALMRQLGGPEEVKSKLQQILDDDMLKDPTKIDAVKLEGELPDGKKSAAKPQKGDAETPPENAIRPDEKAKVSTKEVTKTKRKPPRKGKKRKEVDKPPAEERPEIITIVEPGVYEIDLENLMDKSPIIIMRDGTYLLHLPSLFNKRIKK